MKEWWKERIEEWRAREGFVKFLREMARRQVAARARGSRQSEYWQRRARQTARARVRRGLPPFAEEWEQPEIRQVAGLEQAPQEETRRREGQPPVGEERPGQAPQQGEGLQGVSGSLQGIARNAEIVVGKMDDLEVALKNIGDILEQIKDGLNKPGTWGA